MYMVPHHTPGRPSLRLLTTAEALQEQSEGALLLDTRPAERFARLFIRGAVQIGLQGPFASWAAMLIRPTQPIALLAADLEDAEEARIRLARVGLESVTGYALAQEQRWLEGGVSVASMSIHGTRSLNTVLQNNPTIQLVDVRSRSEWLKGHLPGAISLPLLDLESKGQFIDPSRPSLVYCYEGYRATTAASILLKGGAGDVAILIDGIEGWLASGLPLETTTAR